MKIKKLLMVIFLISLLLSACDPHTGDEVDSSSVVDLFFKILGTIIHDGYQKWIAGGGIDKSLKKDKDQYGYIPDPPEPILPIDPAAPNSGTSAPISNLPLKPVGFVNYGTINATVHSWTYVPLGTNEPQTPAPAASTVSSAQGSGGDWPNSNRFISVPLGTYTWCIDWEEEDQDEDGYFDYYHYFETEPILLDENDSDDLEFAVEVSINVPPDTAPIYLGKCGESEEVANCYGKTTFVQTFVRHVNQEPIYPMDVQAVANTNFRVAPEGINISFSGSAGDWSDGKILWSPGDWIGATTSDPYSAMGVQIFGDKTIGWARVLFDGTQIWEGDTSECVINPNGNNGLGWYGIYVEVLCFPPGTHTIRVESSQTKEGVGGWQGGVPVGLFGFRR